MAAMLEHINNNFSRHILTIEDPIEYQFEDKKSLFSQRELGVDCRSFADSIRQGLRQDPDIMLVGEMRDEESLRVALRAVNTGHLVISTLHASDTVQSLTRLLELFPEVEREIIRKNLAETLVAVIGQRLAAKKDENGLVPCLEILVNETMVSNLIYNNRLNKLHTMIETHSNLGMCSFNQYALKLLKQGIISQEVAESLVNNPNVIQMALRGIQLNDDKQGIIGID